MKAKFIRIIMAKEIKTDFWVNELLKSANIHLEAQGGGIKN